MNRATLKPPYLLFLGDATSRLDCKTALGLVEWRPEVCIGQLRYPNCRVDTGLPDMDIRQARRAGARSVVIGIAPSGGALKPDWESTLAGALDAGLDLVSGLHTPLDSIPRLANAAYRSGSRLVDVRRPPAEIPLATGLPRTGKRVLTVGTDCAVGKKYTALALHRALRREGVDASFRATGQTGIMIAGAGIPVDAVVADFLSGAAEMLSPANDPEHWDVIEGQGSLFHPAYAAVTLGLLHGSQPDALVLCHEPGRRAIDEYPGYPIPSLKDAIRTYEEAARLTNPKVRCIGISLNTAGLSVAERDAALAEARELTGLPAVDPVALGVEPLVREIVALGTA